MESSKLFADRIFGIAAAAGFSVDNAEDQMCGLTGASSIDDRAYVHEYPIGDKLLRFARMLLDDATWTPEK